MARRRARYGSNHSVADFIAVGVPYKDLLKAQADSGQIDAARGREQAFIDDWVKQHQIADGTTREQPFADGRTIRLSEHRTSSGGIVAVRTDITDFKAAEPQLDLSTITAVHLVFDRQPKGVIVIDRIGIADSPK